jgi:hypothetical protein
MFLHSGASLHGHEFSPITASTARRYPLVRSAFPTSSPKASAYNSSTTLAIQSKRRHSAGPRKAVDHVSFQELDTDTMSDDGRSFANSEGSGTTIDGMRRRRRSIRSSTSYHLAHPAPTLTRQQKLLLIRPKLLLQLQRLSPEIRPTPSVDVLPSTVVVPRLMKKFPRMFRGKGELGANDVIIVRSEDYNAPDDDNDEDLGDDESLANREVLAVVCQLRGYPGSAEICLHDGSIWHATYSPATRAFEFVTTDFVTGQKTTARWVQRTVSRRVSDIPIAATNVAGNLPDYKFLFSILNPNSRRHPILASITQQVLDIPDTYTSVSSSAGRHPPTSSMRTSSGSQPSFDESESSERTTHIVDDALRILIQVTGVWIALRLGWCPYFKYDDKYDEASITRGTLASSSIAGNRTRSSSLTYDGGVGDTNANTPDSNQGSLNNMGGKIRWSGNHMFRHSPSSTASPTQFDTGAPVPKRAVSTGTAFMQRAAARRTTIPHSTFQSDSEGESIRSNKPCNNEFNSSPGNRRSTPSPLALLGSSTTLETPTKPFHRRAQSVLMASSTAQTEQNVDAQTDVELNDPAMYTMSKKQGQALVQNGQQQKNKGGRWRSLLGFFRRDNCIR